MLELDPDHVQSHNNLGVIYQATGLFDLAQEEFRKAIKIDPTYEPALINLARLYLDLAARQYEDLVKLKPDDPELARAYRQVLALKLRPNYPEAGYRFGMTQYFLERYAE
ncbi:MAG: tetratricopeptide repeat protein, partial [Nitrospinae bacterium]|nr:tetratricopeptide repeat protein [Nitrospinota bacterium]